jgi:hypothetical protein
MVDVSWRGLGAESQTDLTAATPSGVDSSHPIGSTKTIQPLLTTASPDSACTDAEWFGSREVLSAVDKASASIIQTRTHSPVILPPSRTSSAGSSASTQLHCTRLPAIKPSSESDVEDGGFVRPPKTDLALYARPFPHVARTPVVVANPYPSAISISSESSISSIGASVVALGTPIPASKPHQQVIHAYGHFNPIIPPGPITENWLLENGWAPQWGTVVRKVAEENTLGNWVPVLMDVYGIDGRSAEALMHCIMKDFALVGSVSGSGPLGC